MAWWDGLDFNLGSGGFEMPALDPSMFNINMPAIDPQWFQVPDFSIPDFSLGFDPSFFNFNTDPLALPTLPPIPMADQFSLGPTGGMQPDFSQFGIPDQQMQGLGGPPLALSELGLQFGGANAPDLAPPPERMFAGSDPLPSLMGESPMGPYAPDMDAILAGPGSTPLPGTAYASPFSSNLNLGGYEDLGGGMDAATGRPMSEQDKFYAEERARRNQPPSKWDIAAKLGGAFGPLALGGAGIGLQMANRPERNPLEDELMRARIDSSKQQDALAKERLAFEREHAARALEAQAAMQAAMLEARKPGGQANITALLQGNPQLAALYQALTSQGTNLASGSGSPEFQALIDQIAQVDVSELRRQADEQKAQAMEMSNRQGVNPANIIAKIEQTFMQEAAKARANARNVLIQQMQPGINTFNSVGGLFGNLFQVPGA